MTHRLRLVEKARCWGATGLSWQRSITTDSAHFRTLSCRRLMHMVGPYHKGFAGKSASRDSSLSSASVTDRPPARKEFLALAYPPFNVIRPWLAFAAKEGGTLQRSVTDKDGRICGHLALVVFGKSPRIRTLSARIWNPACCRYTKDLKRPHIAGARRQVGRRPTARRPEARPASG